jgi:hypothetical protein
MISGSIRARSGESSGASFLPLRGLVHEFRHLDWTGTNQLIAGIARHNGNIVLHLTTSIECSGGWNNALREDSLV